MSRDDGDCRKVSSDVQLQPGDVVIGRRGEMGRCAVVGAREADMAVRLHGSLIMSPIDRVVCQYLQRVLSIRSHRDDRGRFGRIDDDQPQPRRSPRPSDPYAAPEEQRAIAAALSEVDDLVAALDALIEKKRAVKTAAMQRLLTGRQRLPGFSGEWETKTLREIGDVLEGWLRLDDAAARFGPTAIATCRMATSTSRTVTNRRTFTSATTTGRGSIIPLGKAKSSSAYAKTVMSSSAMRPMTRIGASRYVVVANPTGVPFDLGPAHHVTKGSRPLLTTLLHAVPRFFYGSSWSRRSDPVQCAARRSWASAESNLNTGLTVVCSTFPRKGAAGHRCYPLRHGRRDRRAGGPPREDPHDQAGHDAGAPHRPYRLV